MPSQTDEHPLHGDPWPGNIVATPDGFRYIDFEAACRGPREWDWTMVPEASAAMTDDVDADLIEQLRPARIFGTAVWCWKQFGSSRRVDDAARYHVRVLRRMLD
jgi:thiamine kinase-like enzyme